MPAGATATKDALANAHVCVQSARACACLEWMDEAREHRRAVAEVVDRAVNELRQTIHQHRRAASSSCGGAGWRAEGRGSIEPEEVLVLARADCGCRGKRAGSQHSFCNQLAQG